MMIRRSRIASAIRSAAESPKGKKLPPVYHEKLKALALEAKREYLRTCQPTPDAHILSGHCGSATEFLVGYLQKRGIPAKIVNGVYFFKSPEDEEYYHPGNSLGHNWVEAYGHVIDITGDQWENKDTHMEHGPVTYGTYEELPMYRDTEKMTPEEFGRYA
jgi:hypothetical protein